MATDPKKTPAQPPADAKMDDLEVDPKMYHVDLEVDNRKHLSEPEVVKLDYSDLEVLPGFGMLEGMQGNNLQAYHPEISRNDTNGAILYHSGNQEPEMKIPVDGEEVPKSEDQKKKRRICGMVPRVFWIVVAVLVLVAVAGAVGGALGARAASKASQADASSRATGTTSAAGGTPSQTAAANNGIRPDSQLAALAWNVSSTRYKYRVYYQDTDNSLKESAYDSSSSGWTVTKILDGSNVLPGTYIAASAPRQAKSGSDAVDINVFFFDTNSKLSVISASSGNWPGGSSYRSINEAAFGKITAYYNGCNLCSKTTLVAVGSKGSVTFYNHSATESWEDEKGLLITDNALEDSSVTLAPYSISGYADQVNIYYQRSDKNLVIVCWLSEEHQIDNNEDYSATDGWGFNRSNSLLGSLEPNASVAVLEFGDNDGSPAYGEVITSGTSGVGLQVYEWQPHTWRPATQPDALQDVTNGTAIAAHSYQRVYAVADGRLIQFAVDNYGKWSSNAVVLTL